MPLVRTVFLVDDSEPMRQILSARLEELAGVQIVGQAGTVAAALEGIEQVQPAVVILDLHLADGSGLKVLEAVKQGENPPLVIVLTQYAQAAYREHCLEGGADYFFDKAGEFDELMEVMRGLAL